MFRKSTNAAIRQVLDVSVKVTSAGKSKFNYLVSGFLTSGTCSFLPGYVTSTDVKNLADSRIHSSTT